MKITSKQLFDKIEKAGAVHDANNLFERKATIVIQKGRDDSLFSSSLCIFFKNGVEGRKNVSMFGPGWYEGLLLHLRHHLAPNVMIMG